LRQLKTRITGCIAIHALEKLREGRTVEPLIALSSTADIEGSREIIKGLHKIAKNIPIGKKSMHKRHVLV